MKTTALFLSLLFLLSFDNSYAQDETKLKKAIATFQDGKQEKGMKQVRNLIKKENHVLYWDILVQMERDYYYSNKQETDALSALLEESLQGLVDTLGGDSILLKINSPSDIALDDFMQSCMEGTRLSNSLYASQYLRNHLVDYNPDKTVNEASKEAYIKAEKAFGEERFDKAVLYYTKAINKQPDYYKALLYLGDAYWYLEHIDSAIYFFEKAASLAPDLLEPQKYLADAFGYQEDYQTAAKKCWNGIYIYPDLSMFAKLEDALDKMGKRFDRHWIPRPISINQLHLEQKEKVKDNVWNKYRQAKAIIKPYCDRNGLIVKDNNETAALYLEVFAWEKMLESDLTKHTELAFAKKMQEEGYLDCYVLLSLFHHGFYQQYRHFIKNNPTKIKTYIERYLIE